MALITSSFAFNSCSLLLLLVARGHFCVQFPSHHGHAGNPTQSPPKSTLRKNLPKMSDFFIHFISSPGPAQHPQCSFYQTKQILLKGRDEMNELLIPCSGVSSGFLPCFAPFGPNSLLKLNCIYAVVHFRNCSHPGRAVGKWVSKRTSKIYIFHLAVRRSGQHSGF